MRKFEEINLVLSGGAAKGIAHIGVLKAINELGIRVRALSGVSAGAIVSVFYASGYSPEGMFSLLKRVNWLKLFKFKPPLKGLIGWEKAIRFLEEVLPYRRIEKLEIPTYICATDLYSGRALYLSEGSLIPALLGSCAIPGIFEPVEYKNYLLVDGGIVNNLPVEPFQESGIPTVCVDVLPIEPEKDIKNILHILLRSFFLAVRSNSEKRKEFCDLVIVPELEEFTPLDVRKADQIMERGYIKALEVLSE
ncbi:patatin-like phospholipase family protein [Aquifex pyrophilus]